MSTNQESLGMETVEAAWQMSNQKLANFDESLESNDVFLGPSEKYLWNILFTTSL